jgi:hypothetical protein
MAGHCVLVAVALILLPVYWRESSLGDWYFSAFLISPSAPCLGW